MLFEGFGKGLNAKRCLQILHAKKVKLGINSMLKLFHDLRVVIYKHMIRCKEFIKIGGPFMNVEMEESLINHTNYNLRILN